MQITQPGTEHQLYALVASCSQVVDRVAIFHDWHEYLHLQKRFTKKICNSTTKCNNS